VKNSEILGADSCSELIVDNVVSDCCGTAKSKNFERFLQRAYPNRSENTILLPAPPRGSTAIPPAVRARAAGEEITIANRGVPVARLVPVHDRKGETRKLGIFRGKFVVPDDFDSATAERDLGCF
jgi:antitoxin (DNA-binding transcriptional repressor) of toxin-antitoxin stability system